MDLPLYFVSDVHLMLEDSPVSQQRQERFFRMLDRVAETGGTLFIVGDLMDFYFEYSHVIPKRYFPLFVRIQALRQHGVEVHFVLGNHDYWVLEFIQGLVSKVYFSDFLLETHGKRFFITHGDGLLSWDKGYRVLKAIIRNPVFIMAYRWLHPNLGYRFADWISRRGRYKEHSEEYNRRVMDELTVHAENHFQDNIDYFITGHYHQAVEKEIGAGKLIILGDWIRLETFAIFDGNDLSMKCMKDNE